MTRCTDAQASKVSTSSSITLDEASLDALAAPRIEVPVVTGDTKYAIQADKDTLGMVGSIPAVTERSGVQGSRLSGPRLA